MSLGNGSATGTELQVVKQRTGGLPLLQALPRASDWSDQAVCEGAAQGGEWLFFTVKINHKPIRNSEGHCTNKQTEPNIQPDHHSSGIRSLQRPQVPNNSLISLEIQIKLVLMIAEHLEQEKNCRVKGNASFQHRPAHKVSPKVFSCSCNKPLALSSYLGSSERDKRGRVLKLRWRREGMRDEKTY